MLFSCSLPPLGTFAGKNSIIFDEQCILSCVLLNIALRDMELSSCFCWNDGDEKNISQLGAFFELRSIHCVWKVHNICNETHMYMVSMLRSLPHDRWYILPRSLHTAMKTYGGVRVKLHTFIRLGTRWRLVVSFTLWPIYFSRKQHCHWIGWIKRERTIFAKQSIMSTHVFVYIQLGKLITYSSKL